MLFRSKLVKLQVGHPAATPPGHGQAVAAGAIRIAGIEIGFAGAARGQCNAFGLKQRHHICGYIKNIGAGAANFARIIVSLGDQIYSSMLLKYINILCGNHLVD